MSGATADTDATAHYLASLDVADLARRGVSYRDSRFGLAGLKPLEDIDIVFDYRFDRLEETRRRLAAVDRPRVLRRIFDSVTACAKTPTDIMLRTVWFVHMNMFANIVQAMWPDRCAVYDPLILLELSEYRCGCAARLVLDILEAGTGWPGRLVLLGSHVIAEVFYEDRWHLVEPSYFPDGIYPCLADGQIPSLRDLEQQPELIDCLPTFLDPATDVRLKPDGTRRREFHTPRRASTPYLSRLYFAMESYAEREIEYLTKRRKANRAVSHFAEDRDYGWLDYSLSRADYQPRRPNMDKWMPRAPRITAIRVDNSSGSQAIVTVRWDRSEDGDGDLVGYRVMVGSRSRQWNYPSYDGPATLAHLVSAPHPDPLAAYRGQLSLPPHDVLDVVTSETEVRFEVATGQTIYLSVSAQDAYGLAIGRQQFYPDTEFAIRT